MKLEDAIKGIQAHRELIHKENLWEDPISLSDTMTRLAVYNSYLADNIAPLHKNATDKAYGVFSECKADGMATNRAEIEARGNSTEERMLHENTEKIYKSTANLITVLQSRLRVIENARRQEGVEQ